MELFLRTQELMELLVSMSVPEKHNESDHTYYDTLLSSGL